MNDMTQGLAAEFVPFRPYFDILSAKTAKINCGFVSLIFGRKKDMRSFMYELVISSIGYPFCRTRIGYNLLLTPNTQRNYERCSKTLEKRHNYIQFSKHLVDSLSKLTRDKIQQVIRKGGKFKQTEKYIYRQEGNSFKNNIRWVKSEKASRLKLSHDILEKYKLSKVVFSGESKNPHYKKSRQSTPYAMFRIQMGKEFFAVKRGSCAVASNPEGFESFEPFFKYEKNGDFLVDSGNISPSYLLSSTASS
jgi:site-specific DNA-cytosine methylase